MKEAMMVLLMVQAKLLTGSRFEITDILVLIFLQLQFGPAVNEKKNTNVEHLSQEIRQGLKSATQLSSFRSLKLI